MQIMTILGSPRLQGNTAKVLGWIEDQFRTDRHDLDHVSITDYHVQGCGECMACKKGTVELCSIGDDANALFRRMVAADLVLIAAPVFCWGFPAQLKGLIDRLYCLMDFAGERENVPRLYGKPMALVLTAGGDEKDNVDLVVRGFEKMVKLLRANEVGRLLICDCAAPEAIKDDVRSRAVEFADTLLATSH